MMMTSMPMSSSPPWDVMLSLPFWRLDAKGGERLGPRFAFPRDLESHKCVSVLLLLHL
jgi:hypothetical protein